MRTFALHLLTDASAEQISLLSQSLKESSDASGCNPDWVDLSVKGRERPYYPLTLSQRQCLLRQVGFLFHLQQVHLQQVLAQQAANRYPLGLRKTDKAQVAAHIHVGRHGVQQDVLFNLAKLGTRAKNVVLCTLNSCLCRPAIKSRSDALSEMDIELA